MENENGGLSLSDDLWWPLEGKTKKLTDMSNEDWDILDRKALGTI